MQNLQNNVFIRLFQLERVLFYSSNEWVRSSMMNQVNCLCLTSIFLFATSCVSDLMLSNDRSLNRSLMFTLLCLLVACRYVVLCTAFRSRLELVYILCYILYFSPSSRPRMQFKSVSGDWL